MTDKAPIPSSAAQVVGASASITSASAPMASLSPIETAKRKAAYRAVEDHFSPDFHYVGIGSGSTVVYVVEAIAAKGPAVTSKIIFVPTGFQSRELIVEAGLPLGSIDSLVPLETTKYRKFGDSHADVATGKQDMGLKGERVMLDVAFDGADEVDEGLNCIKGGGGCLFQEKLVATSAKKFVCVADFRKYQTRLLSKWPTIPIEIVREARGTVLRQLKTLGSPAPFIRQGGSSKAGPAITDNNNFIIDAPFPPLLTPSDLTDDIRGDGKYGKWEVLTLAKELKSIVGVLEHGLFAGRNGAEVTAAGEEGGGQKPIAAYFGMESGEVEVRSAKDINL
ncbi:MAG: ribose-5-phosphate isomerase rki1 [Vezdaea aestivalis]|nr:MAG: ribose-5-phosphate isomerase rki1 [Vezdaea aestivalis]